MTMQRGEDRNGRQSEREGRHALGGCEADGGDEQGCLSVQREGGVAFHMNTNILHVNMLLLKHYYLLPRATLTMLEGW